MADKKSLCEKLECPVCLDYLEVPIIQCVVGHSFCSKCLNPNNIKKCPECRSDILETRNYKLEEIITGLPFPCENKKAGCPFLLPKDQLVNHILECKYRSFKCEGKKFCNWKCNWEGHDILKHFKTKHERHTSMEYNTRATTEFNSTSKFTDIQIISAHYQLFWYKHKIDLKKKQALWAFQYIGPKIQASYYYYEFEIFSEADDIRRYKIMEYCHSDTVDVDTIFNSEKCVAISFKTLGTYVNEKNQYCFRFRLMKKKKEETPSEPKAKSSKEPLPRTQPPVYSSPHPRPVMCDPVVWLATSPPVHSYRYQPMNYPRHQHNRR